MAQTVLIEAESGSLTIGGTDYTTQVKEILVTGGDRDINMVRTHGNGQWEDHVPMTPLEIQLTCVAMDTDFRAMLMGGKLVSGGEGSAVESWPRTPRTLEYNWFDETDVSGAQLKLTFASVYATATEFRLNATDHAEETVTFKCLPKYFQPNYTENRVTDPV